MLVFPKFLIHFKVLRVTFWSKNGWKLSSVHLHWNIFEDYSRPYIANNLLQTCSSFNLKSKYAILVIGVFSQKSKIRPYLYPFANIYDSYLAGVVDIWQFQNIFCGNHCSSTIYRFSFIEQKSLLLLRIQILSLFSTLRHITRTLSFVALIGPL